MVEQAPQRGGDASRRAVAGKLYDLLQQAGITQSELARKTGIKKAALSTYFTAKSYPSMESLDILAKFFKVKPSDIVPPGVLQRNPYAEKASAVRFELDIRPGRARIVIDAEVSNSTALKVGALLEDDKLDKAD